jgi:hypothetical protein
MYCQEILSFLPFERLLIFIKDPMRLRGTPMEERHRGLVAELGLSRALLPSARTPRVAVYNH